MKNLKAFEQIAALRAERGETLAQFALAVGISSKGRISEMEKGLVRPTVAQALAIEKLSGGRINAAALNYDIAAARDAIMKGSNPVDWQLSDNEIMGIGENHAIEARTVLCITCDMRMDDLRRADCSFIDCPHSEGMAA